MFNLSSWLVEGIKAGYADHTFPFARITELTAGYLSRALITQKQAEDIAQSCPPPETEAEGAASCPPQSDAQTKGGETT